MLWSYEDNRPVAGPGASTSTGRYLSPITGDTREGKGREEGMGVEISRGLIKRFELLDSALPERLPRDCFFPII